MQSFLDTKKGVLNWSFFTKVILLQTERKTPNIDINGNNNTTSPSSTDDPSQSNHESINNQKKDIDSSSNNNNDKDKENVEKNNNNKNIGSLPSSSPPVDSSSTEEIVFLQEEMDFKAAVRFIQTHYLFEIHDWFLSLSTESFVSLYKDKFAFLSHPEQVTSSLSFTTQSYLYLDLFYFYFYIYLYLPLSFVCSRFTYQSMLSLSIFIVFPSIGLIALNYIARQTGKKRTKEKYRQLYILSSAFRLLLQYWRDHLGTFFIHLKIISVSKLL